jgi:hypothetical protein
VSPAARQAQGTLFIFQVLPVITKRMLPIKLKIETLHSETITRLILFSFFFLAGLAVMMMSLLFNDFHGYYRNGYLLANTKSNVDKLKALNDDYDTLLRQLHSDPQFAERLAAATLGIEPKENKDVVYPRETATQLAVARSALTKESESASGESAGVPPIPRWVERCKASNRRFAVFIAGSALILIAFTYFGPRFSQSPTQNFPITKFTSEPTL